MGACSAETRSASSDFTDEMPEDLPAGKCGDTDGSSTSGSGTDGLEACDGASSSGLATTSSTGDTESECAGEDDCNGAGACVADWDEAGRGPFTCQFACIPTLDESTWCSDDASCCDAAATCTARGYCLVAGDSGDGSGSGSSTGS